VQVASDAQFTNLVLEKDSLLVASLATSALTPGTTYYWRVAGTNKYVDGSRSDVHSFTASQTTQSVAANRSIETHLANYPEPLRQFTTVRFALPATLETRLELFSMDGRKVEEYACGRLGEGEHEVRWEFDEPSGNYLLRIVTERGSQEKRIQVRK
jgi:hypothetical protein